LTTIKYREFYGDDFYQFTLKSYEESRVFLRNRGRPKDDYDKFLIAEAKWTSSYFKQMID
jgi:hypothetical protein